MVAKGFAKKLHKISLAMFRKDFIGIFHGSISARVELDKFIINKKEAIFDDITDSDLILLNHTRDYRWHEASLDSEIHSLIYQDIPDAKYIAYTMPPFTMSYTLENDYIVPKDYFGAQAYPDIKVYSPKNFDDWYERADVEISRFLIDSGKDIIIIRGYGIYAYARELTDLAKKLAIIENSCRILLRGER
ncbi:MAG: class II aldolase and adducin N-terminal domain-containing protein [Campylobacterales bacterium]|nr:class II aldolase and adducin N-terminal domain-containing protein [Campylobacterales bacterium]